MATIVCCCAQRRALLAMCLHLGHVLLFFVCTHLLVCARKAALLFCTGCQSSNWIASRSASMTVKATPDVDLDQESLLNTCQRNAQTSKQATKQARMQACNKNANKRTKKQTKQPKSKLKLIKQTTEAQQQRRQRAETMIQTKKQTHTNK